MAWSIDTHHPLMRYRDRIVVEGFNGDSCCISGPGMGEWGPELARGSTGLFEPPVKTNWGPGMLGQVFSSWSPQRRDVVCTIHIMNPQTGDPAMDNDPLLWHQTYSRWRAMFDYQHESTIVYASIDGVRRLNVRLLQEPKPFSTQPFEGGDPHILRYGSIVMALAAENPYYVGATDHYEFEGLGSGSFKIPFFNPSTVPIWPEWYATDRAAYIFPDFSWGLEEFGRGVADTGKTVRVPFKGELLIGEDIHIMTRPDEETIRAANDAPVGNRMGGNDFEYPIQPGDRKSVV